MTVYRYIDCHNITYTTQSEVVDYNTSLSLQTPAVDFTVENETVSMLQYAVTCIYVTAYLLFYVIQIEAYPGKPIKLVITPLNELNCATTDKIQILESSHYNICADNMMDDAVRKVRN